MEDYFNYLLERNKFSFYYRKWLLYPQYSGWLNGFGLEVGCGLGEFLSAL